MGNAQYGDRSLEHLISGGQGRPKASEAALDGCGVTTSEVPQWSWPGAQRPAWMPPGVVWNRGAARQTEVPWTPVGPQRRSDARGRQSVLPQSRHAAVGDGSPLVTILAGAG